MHCDRRPRSPLRCDRQAPVMFAARFGDDPLRYAKDHTAYLASLAYLFPRPSGIGAFQPLVRYQDFEGESALDLGVNYIIRGHNARLSAMYSRTGVESFKTHNFTVGLQVQF